MRLESNPRRMAWEILDDGIQSKMVKIAKMVTVAKITKIRKTIVNVMDASAWSVGSRNYRLKPLEGLYATSTIIE
jgi:hypothetical protein